MIVHKDMLGYELWPGDVVVYPTGRFASMIQRIARVVRSEEAGGSLLVEIRSSRWVREPTTDSPYAGRWVDCLKKVTLTRLHRVIKLRQTGPVEREVFDIPVRVDARFLQFSRPINRSNR